MNTSLNPADVGTRESSVRRPGSLALWLEGPPFLLQERAIVQASGPVVVHKALCTADTVLDPEVGTLKKLIEVIPTLYDLKKLCAYLVAFTEFVVAKAKGNTFTKPKFDATYLDNAFIKIVKYVQSRSFGAAVESLKQESPDQFESII